jgi:hypothetical protein
MHLQQVTSHARALGMGTKEQIEEPVHSIKQRISDDKSLHRVHSSNNREVDKLAREERGIWISQVRCNGGKSGSCASSS